MHPNLIDQRLARLLEGAADVFGSEPAAVEPAVDITVLHAKIGALTLANNFFGRYAREGWPVAKPKAMLNLGHELPLARQAQRLGISCGRLYYLPHAVSGTDLAVIRQTDELHLLYPFAGSRMLRDLLRQDGTAVGRLHVATLVKSMRIEALEEVLARYGRPTIFDSDQGSQFTSTVFTAVLHREQITISMGGRGCWRDNARFALSIPTRVHRANLRGSVRPLGGNNNEVPDSP